VGFSYGDITMLMGGYGVWWWRDSIWKGYGGEYMGIRWKDTFRLSNLSKSKNSQNIFSGSKVALF
jgi:hypothetical protein